VDLTAGRGAAGEHCIPPQGAFSLPRYQQLRRSTRLTPSAIVVEQEGLAVNGAGVPSATPLHRFLRAPPRSGACALERIFYDQLWPLPLPRLRYSFSLPLRCRA